MRRLTQRQRTAAMVLAVLALCFITLDLGGTSLSSAHGGVRGTLGALYRGTDSVLGPARRFVQGLPHAASNEDKVQALQRENTLLRKHLADEQLDRATAARLRALQLAASSGKYRIAPARVTAMSAGQGFDWTVTLDAGRSDGVRVGQTVTDGYALVGRVLHADDSSCVVLLAVDPGSGAGARDTRSGQVGVANGRGSGGFSFVPIDTHARLSVGDQLVTGPTGESSYVSGLAVGTVQVVHTAADGSTSAVLSPATSPTALDVVGVILRANTAGELAGGR